MELAAYIDTTLQKLMGSLYFTEGLLSKCYQFLQSVNHLYGYRNYKSSNGIQALNNSLYVCI